MVQFNIIHSSTTIYSKCPLTLKFFLIIIIRTTLAFFPQPPHGRNFFLLLLGMKRDSYGCQVTGINLKFVKIISTNVIAGS